MKKSILNLARITVILISTVVTLYATEKGSEGLGLLIAGIIFRDFFSSKIYDPIFKDQSAQGWLFSGIKKWTVRRRSKFKFDI